MLLKGEFLLDFCSLALRKETSGSEYLTITPCILIAATSEIDTIILSLQMKTPRSRGDRRFTLGDTLGNGTCIQTLVFPILKPMCFSLHHCLLSDSGQTMPLPGDGQLQQEQWLWHLAFPQVLTVGLTQGRETKYLPSHIFPMCPASLQAAEGRKRKRRHRQLK